MFFLSQILLNAEEYFAVTLILLALAYQCTQNEQKHVLGFEFLYQWRLYFYLLLFLF